MVKELFHSRFVRLSRPQRPVTLHMLLTSPESKYHPATFFCCTVRLRIELGILGSQVRCLGYEVIDLGKFFFLANLTFSYTLFNENVPQRIYRYVTVHLLHSLLYQVPGDRVLLSLQI